MYVFGRVDNVLQTHSVVVVVVFHVQQRICLQGVRSEGKEMILVNPEIVSQSNATELDGEGCLSFPGIYGDIEVCNHT